MRSDGMRQRAPSSTAATQPARPLGSLQQFVASKVHKWHWPALLLLTAVILLASQGMPSSSIHVLSQSVRMQSSSMARRSNLEEQLGGCRTNKTSDPIPVVDKSPSLRVLDTYTPEQRETAEAFTAAVGACDSFACLHDANQLPRAPGQFQYPQFFVVGFPKCATTSIYCHLIQHPQIQHPNEKESHALSHQCEPPKLSNCSAEAQRHYVVDVLNLEEAVEAKFTRAAFEGSTHYVQEDEWFAEGLANLFPWLKIVISMRDPISQAIAMHLHNVAHKRNMKCSDDPNDTSIFGCIRKALKAPNKSQYGPNIQRWMAHFPKERLHIVQYENLTAPATMRGEMHDLKAFLGVDTRLPSLELPLTNYKHQRGVYGVGKYWNMTRAHYSELVDMARNNTIEVVKLLGEHGFANKKGKVAWLMNWERVWKRNMDTCEEGSAGNCRIVAS